MPRKNIIKKWPWKCITSWVRNRAPSSTKYRRLKCLIEADENNIDDWIQMPRNIQTPNANQKSRSSDSEWFILTEYSMGEWMADESIGDNLPGESLFQAIRDIGIPPDCLHRLKRTLSDFTKEAEGQTNQGSPGLPFCIRLFCQKWTAEDACSSKAPDNYRNEQAVKPAPSIQPYGKKMTGGWGYFLIKRGEDSIECPSANPHRYIDLYLYKEGK